MFSNGKEKWNIYFFQETLFLLLNISRCQMETNKKCLTWSFSAWLLSFNAYCQGWVFDVLFFSLKYYHFCLAFLFLQKTARPHARNWSWLKDFGIILLIFFVYNLSSSSSLFPFQMLEAPRAIWIRVPRLAEATAHQSGRKRDSRGKWGKNWLNWRLRDFQHCLKRVYIFFHLLQE